METTFGPFSTVKWYRRLVVLLLLVVQQSSFVQPVIFFYQPVYSYQWLRRKTETVTRKDPVRPSLNLKLKVHFLSVYFNFQYLVQLVSFPVNSSEERPINIPSTSVDKNEYRRKSNVTLNTVSFSFPVCNFIWQYLENQQWRERPF